VTYEAGTTLPPRTLAMTPHRLVMYAGATWDWHRLHYDAPYAEASQLPAPIVDGQHFGGLFTAQVLEDQPSARVTKMALRFRSMVFAGETVTVTGEVTSVDGDEATVTQELHVDDRLCATSVTTVVMR